MTDKKSDAVLGERFDKAFSEFKAENPDATVATFYTRKHVLRNWETEKGHNSLGGKIVNKDGDTLEWKEAGRSKAENWINRYEVDPTFKVVEYGCGTLRVASHFIDYLPKGHFFGLDVIPEIIAKGKELLGADTLAEKAPQLDVIGEQSVADATEFAPDFLYSLAVMHHIHPDELEYYASNIKKIASKPGCRVVFNAMCHDERAVRYGNLGWAQTHDEVVELFKPLELLSFNQGRPMDKEGFTIRGTTFEFGRPA